MNEIALVSVKKYKLEQAVKKGNGAAKIALNLAENPNKFLSTVQIGITLIGILIGVFSSDDLQAGFAEKIKGIELLKPYATQISLITIVSLVTFISIIFGELLPKRIALIFPEKIALALAWPMLWLSRITAPIVWLLTVTNQALLFVLGIRRSGRDKVTEEEIKAIVEESVRGGQIEELEHQIVDRVFALGDRRISELMTHRSHVVWLDINDEDRVNREKMSTHKHNVYPVCDGSFDELLGVIRLKDLYGAAENISDISLKTIIRKPLIIHENKPAYSVLEMFKSAKTHFGFIADEYGAVEGIVTTDDLLDALLGNVSENITQEYQITEIDTDLWVADGQYPYFELLHFLDIPEVERNTNFNTIGGLVMNQLGYLPKVGDRIEWEGFEIMVLDKDGLRIDKVQIKKVA